MSTRLGGTPRHHPNRWRVRMAELLEAIAAADVAGTREGLEEEYEIARQNCQRVEADAEVALRLTADAEAESARLTPDGES